MWMGRQGQTRIYAPNLASIMCSRSLRHPWPCLNAHTQPPASASVARRCSRLLPCHALMRALCCRVITLAANGTAWVGSETGAVRLISMQTSFTRGSTAMLQLSVDGTAMRSWKNLLSAGSTPSTPRTAARLPYRGIPALHGSCPGAFKDVVCKPVHISGMQQAGR